MEPKIKKYLFPLCLFAVFLLETASVEAQIPLVRKKSIRVAILKDVKEFTLSIRGKFDLVETLKDTIHSRKRGLRRKGVLSIENGIRIARDEYLSDYLKVIPHRNSTIYVNGRRFRGEIDIIKTPKGGLLVVNTIELEDYIRGVLYHEVSNRWPLEATKAQAIVARTYALYRMIQNKSQDYDLTDDIFSQVYGGRSSERYRTNIAVDRTKGLILTYRGKVLPSYYHATCGGHTEDVSELWNEDLIPLKGIKCQFCKKSPHYHWKKNFRLKDIQDMLNKHGYDLGLIKEIKVIKRNQSERIKDLLITGRDGKEFAISGKDFRNLIGPNKIKSNNYEVVMKGYYMDLVGKGWGHGVGMCQWGANFMARKRHKFNDILKYYYPGAQIEHFSKVLLNNE